MTDDIVTELRKRAVILFSNGVDRDAFIDDEAADEIERLRADRDRWRHIAKELYSWFVPFFDDDSIYEAGVEAMAMYCEAVRGE